MRECRTHLAELSILLGNRCNFSCAHCAVSARADGQSLHEKEITGLADVIAKWRPRVVLFSGGEPTLSLDLIARILAGAGGRYRPEVTVTTNGYFAATQEDALGVLSSIKYLRRVNLSYDKFHGKFLGLGRLENLYRACLKAGVEFSVLASIQSPLDLVELMPLSNVGDFRVTPFKVLPLGDAIDNALEFRYPEFDRAVLGKKCPDRNKVTYIQGKGFTLCCSSLVFGRSPQDCIYETVESLLSSRFRSMMLNDDFLTLMRRAKVGDSELRPEHSSECGLCSYIFRGGVHLGDSI